MKIGHCASTPATTPVHTGPFPTRAADTPHDISVPCPPDDSPSTTVEVSDTATVLLDRAGDAFDADKVERIRQSIADGSYQVNADAIADRLLSNAHDLLGHLGKPASA